MHKENREEQLIAEVAEWKEKEFRACSKHHEFIDEIERLEMMLNKIYEHDKYDVQGFSYHDYYCKVSEMVADFVTGETKPGLQALIARAFFILHRHAYAATYAHTIEVYTTKTG